MIRSRRGPVLATLFLAPPIVLHAPSPVRDAATGILAPGFRLDFSRSYLLLSPFCALADALTIFDAKEWTVFLAVSIPLLVLWPTGSRHASPSGAWRVKLPRLMGFLAFLAWAALAPRPMGRLVADDPDILLIDFHSHTSFSHDGRRSFTPAANLEWHRRQGFNAAFITDHNASRGAEEGAALSREHWLERHYLSLQGDEASLYRTHLGVLGTRGRIDNRPFDSDPANIPAFIEEMHRRGCLVVAHLPEYWRDHWKRGNTDFLSWNVNGFEIVNSVPYCLDFPPPARRAVVEHCREKNLFMTGATDNHGWGGATAAWSALRIPGWRGLDPDALEAAVFSRLRTDGFTAVHVLERDKFEPDARAGILVSPWANLGVAWLQLGAARSLACIGWVWLVFSVAALSRAVVERESTGRPG